MTEYEYDEFRPISPSAAFFILFGFIGAGLVIGGIAGMIVWYSMTGQGALSIAKDLLNPKYGNAARMFQLVTVLFMFFIPAVATARLLSRKPFSYLGYREGFNSKQIMLTIAIVIFSLPLIGALDELNKAIPLSKSWETYFQKKEAEYNSEVEALSIMRSSAEFVFSLFIMALLPALFEETLFRGGLQQILVSWTKKPMLAILITSIIFSIFHFSYYGFLPRVAMGMILGLLFYYSKSLWLTMALHFINNGYIVSMMYYQQTHSKPVKESAGNDIPIWAGLPALIVLVLLFRVFKQISYKRNIHKIPPMDGPSHESVLV